MKLLFKFCGTIFHLMMAGVTARIAVTQYKDIIENETEILTTKKDESEMMAFIKVCSNVISNNVMFGMYCIGALCWMGMAFNVMGEFINNVLSCIVKVLKK